MPERATDQMLAQRKEEARQRSTTNGHQLSKWSENNRLLGSKCTNEDCIGTASISTDFYGIVLGSAVRSSDFYACPLKMS